MVQLQCFVCYNRSIPFYVLYALLGLLSLSRFLRLDKAMLSKHKIGWSVRYTDKYIEDFGEPKLETMKDMFQVYLSL